MENNKGAAEVGEWKFKTMAETDNDRKPWSGNNVPGKCICGGNTGIIRFFGKNGTMIYCCGDVCYHKIDLLYFKKDE
jgi:hypothetical protein